jgi:hypothetical protein
MICCTEPGLTEALFILYIHKTYTTCKMKKKNWHWTNTANSDCQETDCMPPGDGRMTETCCSMTSEKERKNCCVDGPLLA